jgi:hypothetical protein
VQRQVPSRFSILAPHFGQYIVRVSQERAHARNVRAVHAAADVPITRPTSRRETPSTSSVRTRRSIDTLGSPASIFAFRDWLELTFFASSTCVTRRRGALRALDCADDDCADDDRATTTPCS